MLSTIRAPRIRLGDTNIGSYWATQENFDRGECEGLTMCGQKTSGCWIYIGAQMILQGTYGTFGRPPPPCQPFKPGSTSSTNISSVVSLGKPAQSMLKQSTPTQQRVASARLIVRGCPQSRNRHHHKN